MKDLIRRSLHRLSLEIRRVPPHRHAPYVEDIGLPHVLDVLFRRADDLTFVQVGANDGVCNDLLVSCLATSNPKGILIEPQAEPFRKLQERYGDRERLVVVRGAIDQQRGTRTLYR